MTSETKDVMVTDEKLNICKDLCQQSGYIFSFLDYRPTVDIYTGMFLANGAVRSLIFKLPKENVSHETLYWVILNAIALAAVSDDATLAGLNVEVPSE